jgi:hypothetical protein
VQLVSTAIGHLREIASRRAVCPTLRHFVCSRTRATTAHQHLSRRPEPSLGPALQTRTHRGVKPKNRSAEVCECKSTERCASAWSGRERGIRGVSTAALSSSVHHPVEASLCGVSSAPSTPTSRRLFTAPSRHHCVAFPLLLLRPPRCALSSSVHHPVEASLCGVSSAPSTPTVPLSSSVHHPSRLAGGIHYALSPSTSLLATSAHTRSEL